MNIFITILISISLCLITPAWAFTDFTYQIKCPKVAGTYISRNILTGSPDTQEETLRNRIVMVNRDGTIATYQSAQLDKLDAGNEMAPAMGNWQCVGKQTIQAVAFDYFSRGIGLGGNPIGEQEWNEFDRISIQIDFSRKPAIMKLRLIGIDKTDDANKLDPNVQATVVSEIRAFELERISPIQAIVHADFSRD